MDPRMPPSGGRLEVLTGAHNFQVNRLHFTQAHTIQHHNSFQHLTSGPIGLTQLLNPLHDASHKRNRKIAPPDSQCLPGTRGSLLVELRDWVVHETTTQQSQTQSDTRSPICWMYGSFGCGKSAMAQTLAEEYASKGRLAASFFFFRGAGGRSNIDGFARTLAHQISSSIPGAKVLIEQAVLEDRGLAEEFLSLDWQLQHLVFEPLAACLREGTHLCQCEDSYLMVVDGLDECTDKEGISKFIDLSIAFFSQNPNIPLRLFITSRIEEHIRTHVEAGASNIHLINLSSRPSRADVAFAMRATFENAKKHDRALRALGYLWPSAEDMYTLVNYCDGSFIFGSTLAKFILQGSGDLDPRTPMERLPLALKISPGIDGVYSEVLSRAQHLPHFLAIISTIALVQIPLSISAISALLEITTYEVIRVLVLLQAILQVPGRDDEPVTVFHTSLRDFLVDKTRSGLFHSPPSHHTYLMHRCLDILIGTEPTANPECCSYALIYWPAHSRNEATLENALDEELEKYGGPYKPIILSRWARNDFKSRKGDERPISFVVPPMDWSTLEEVLHRALRNLRFDDGDYVCEFPGDRRPKITTPTENDSPEGPGSRIWSLKDIVQGLQYLSQELIDGAPTSLSIRRGVGVVVSINVARRRTPENWDLNVTITQRIDTGPIQPFRPRHSGYSPYRRL